MLAPFFLAALLIHAAVASPAQSLQHLKKREKLDLPESHAPATEDIKQAMPPDFPSKFAKQDDIVQQASYNDENETDSLLKNKPLSAQNKPSLKKTAANQDNISTEDEQHIESNPDLDNSVMAFTVELSEDTDVLEGATIMFDKVLVNEGDAYLTNIGVFYCNNDDLYILMWTLHSPTVYQGDLQAKAKLFLGDEEVKYGPLTEIQHSCSSVECIGSSQMMAVSYCQVGKGFRLEAERWSDSDAVTTYSAANTSFTGFRISPYDKVEVGFSAELSQDISIFPDYPIIFDSVLLDTGNNFDPRFGFFVCPDNGIYSFSWSMQASGNTKAEASLYMGDEEMLAGPRTYKLYYDTSPNSNSGTSMSSIILQCNEGDQVYVRNEEPDVNNNPYSELDAYLTSFSGYRIGNAPGTTAFSAVLDEDQQVVVDTIIQYKTVLINLGGYYYPTIGSFICPNNNYFMFMWSVKSSSYYNVYVHLVMSGVEVKAGPVTSYTGSSSQGSGGTASMSAVVHCSQGASIAVQVENTYKTTQTFYFEANYNYFSGFQLPGQ